MRNTVILLLALVWSGGVLSDPFAVEFEELAPGVWTGVREDGPRFPVMGTITFVVGERGVVVFDGGGVPLMSERTIEKIRSVTDLPVTHVVISHWHGDHHFGIYRILEEYPNAEVVTHDFTQRAMLGSPLDYVARYSDGIERITTSIKETQARGNKQEDGTPVSAQDITNNQRILDDASLIDPEFKRVAVELPTLTFDNNLTILSGEQRIELLFLGDGNTAGDIVMWLPDERIVATGDLVVLPTPYAFNVPPRRWAETLRRLNALNYDILIPGHGAIQRDTTYVDLIIETADAIADQRDTMVAAGVDHETIESELDFSSFRERFTGGDEYIALFYDVWFEGPFRKAAIKELNGEPMVAIKPSTLTDNAANSSPE